MGFPEYANAAISQTKTGYIPMGVDCLVLDYIVGQTNMGGNFRETEWGELWSGTELHSKICTIIAADKYCSVRLFQLCRATEKSLSWCPALPMAGLLSGDWIHFAR